MPSAAIKRSEQRYVVEQDKAIAMRDHVRNHLKLDEHGQGNESFSYEVHSLYLDSDDLQLFWSCINDDENQVRMRLRFYADDPAEAIFLETKQRLKDRFVKERTPVKRDAVALLFTETETSPDFLISRTQNQMLALDCFCQLVRSRHLRPKLHLSFSREAYRGDNASLNFDRFVRAEPDFSTKLRPEMQRPIFVWGNDVVVELKFIDREPEIFRDIIRRFDLRSCEVEKYVDAVALHGERHFRR